VTRTCTGAHPSIGPGPAAHDAVMPLLRSVSPTHRRPCGCTPWAQQPPTAWPRPRS